VTIVDPFPVIQASGFTAHVDAFAAELEPDPSTHLTCLHFLSLLGSKQAVQAIWARLVKGEPATLSREVLETSLLCTLNPLGPRGWKLSTASLPGAAGYHAVLVPAYALVSGEEPAFVILPRQPGEAAALHFRFLDHRIDLPLHPTWADWLWDRARRAGEALALESFGLAAYRCAPEPATLATDLTAAVRQGILQVPKKDDQAQGRDEFTAARRSRRID
jgi:hypothetical protein